MRKYFIFAPLCISIILLFLSYCCPQDNTIAVVRDIEEDECITVESFDQYFDDMEFIIHHVCGSSAEMLEDFNEIAISKNNGQMENAIRLTEEFRCKYHWGNCNCDPDQ